PYTPAPPPPPLPPDDPLLSIGRDRPKTERRKSVQRRSYFGDMFKGWGGNGAEGGCFESDHCFDNFASPVSNPFLFEDPRSLTEIRPIFMYQTIPGSNPVFRGGHTEFFGTQARLAVTDRWSFVMNKIGGVSVTPGGDSL